MHETMQPSIHYDAIRDEWTVLSTAFDLRFNRGVWKRDRHARCNAMLRDIKRMAKQLQIGNPEGYRRYYAVANPEVLTTAMEVE